MSVQFKVVAIQIPKSFSDDNIKAFLDANTQLKLHDKPDDSEHYITHHQSKRKKAIDEQFTVKCQSNQEVLLVCSL